MAEKKRIVFGISGASGMPLARAILEDYRQLGDLEIHLIFTAGAHALLRAECQDGWQELASLASAAYAPDDLAAPPASGSWRHCGMIVCPCSMNSLAAIANGMGGNLLRRAADVALKENAPLVLAPRETPLNRVHLRNMLAAAEAGAVIMPFAPAFYTHDLSMRGAMRQFAGRLLDQLGIANDLCERWRENP